MKKLRLILTSTILLCISLIVVAQQDVKRISMEDLMLHGTFRQNSVHGLRSMNDGIHYTTLEGNGTKIVKYSFATGKVVETLFDLSEMKDTDLKHISGYEFSADEKRILLTSNQERIYRRSFTADYYVFTFKNKRVKSFIEKW